MGAEKVGRVVEYLAGMAEAGAYRSSGLLVGFAGSSAVLDAMAGTAVVRAGVVAFGIADVDGWVHFVVPVAK